MTKNWYMLYIGHPKKITNARAAFESLGIRTSFCETHPSSSFLMNEKTQAYFYEPIQETERKEFDGRLIVNKRRLYPGYVLVFFDYEKHNVENKLQEHNLGYFLRGPGDQSELPTAVSDAEMEEIKRLTQTMVSKTILQKKIILNSWVEVANGPFINSKGQVVAIKRDKVSVELSFFGRQVLVDVPFEDINELTTNR